MTDLDSKESNNKMRTKCTDFRQRPRGIDPRLDELQGSLHRDFAARPDAARPPHRRLVRNQLNLTPDSVRH
jgi:hypothetical protein